MKKVSWYSYYIALAACGVKVPSITKLLRKSKRAKKKAK